MRVDAVILSCSKDSWLYGLSQRTINTLVHGNRDVDVRVIVIESDPEAAGKGFVYPGCEVLVPSETFNYNRFMRMGLRLCASDYVLMCNNDLIFLPGSLGKLVRTTVVGGYLSASPYEPNYHPRQWPLNPPGDVEGHKVGNHVCGWCILASRQMLMGEDFLDEKFAFWHQDVDYSCTLLKKGIKHVLVRDALVRHEFSASHGLLGERHEMMTKGMHELAVKKWVTSEVDWMAVQEGRANRPSGGSYEDS